MSQENVAATRALLDAWNRGDLDAVLEPAHPDIEFTSDVVRRLEGSEGLYRGTEQMRKFWDEFRGVWALTIDVSEIRDLDDTVLVLAEGQVRGSASGIDLESPLAYVLEFDGGLIRKGRVYLDQAEALDAVGLLE
jgi:ketosteroid isomerase-like protein